ncbi:MAG: hypothetical protein ACI94L_001229, partial [Flavobacteriaceae bacterium]
LIVLLFLMDSFNTPYFIIVILYQPKMVTVLDLTPCEHNSLVFKTKVLGLETIISICKWEMVAV